MARRPTSFKEASRIEKAATLGLSKDRILGNCEKTSNITLTAWANLIRVYLEERGLCTVFRIFDPVRNTDIYLLKYWG